MRREKDLSKRQQIEESNEKLSLLREQTDKLEAEASELAERRDKLNERFKKLREETTELKLERDKANEKVRELKLKRDEAKAAIHQRIEELKDIRQEIKNLADKKPSKPLQFLQEQFDSIEWKIQTTSLSLEEEKELVEQVRQTETQLKVYRKLALLKQKSLELQTEIKTLQAEGKTCHEALTEIAQKSQECHQKMLAKIEESKKIKIEADSLHKTFVQTREKTRPLQEQIAYTLNKMRQLKGEIREEQQKEKKQSEETIRNELEKQAREKLKRGQKLTWEEFQLLAEKGIDP
jgi:uncharacterized coiled-coil DUF342 family protein